MVGTKLGQEKQAAARCGLSHEEWKRRRDSGQARCYVCKEWKSNLRFARDKSRPNGRASICNDCNNRRSTASRYGLTVEQMDALPGADGVCPICRRVHQPMEVDHNHKTGAARALLCSRCNGGLGAFEDDPAQLRRAAEYLEKHDGR